MPNALILGASRGLGLGLAGELARRKWTVWGTVRKEEDRPALEQAGAKTAIADITDPASITALKPALSQLDLLFVNAGISEPADLGTIDEAGVGHLFMTNAVGPVRAALALVDCLAPTGMIAFMSSRMGSVSLTTADNKAMYRASKAALNSMTRAMMPRFGLERPVLTLHPGWVATDMGGSGADLDVPTSVSGLADVIEERRGKAGSCFLDYSGSALAW
jgi:NAD(P)-dependent dehydrogenase (short-subunit alcohol dehydrogenase family)